MNQSYYIVGPCAAESLEQILAVARTLEGSEILRAGVWKPRTSPDSFQGAGEQALAWLAEARRQTGHPVATEVATPEHACLSIRAGIDYLWIGARTSANPIAVQAIADALRSQEQKPKGVFVKNPVNEDTALWLGNIARIEASGVPAMAIHRGCGHRPCWQMAFELRTARPEIPLLLDPSHLSGDAARVPDLCRQAIGELGLNGLMVEVHPEPKRALSDRRQQLTPMEWRETASFLPLRDTTSPKGKGCNSIERVRLNWLRAIMDETDDELWAVMARRMEVSRRIGELKHHAGLEIVQPDRWQQVIKRRLDWAVENGMNEEEVRTIMNAIHRMSVDKQNTL